MWAGRTGYGGAAPEDCRGPTDCWENRCRAGWRARTKLVRWTQGYMPARPTTGVVYASATSTGPPGLNTDCPMRRSAGAKGCRCLSVTLRILIVVGARYRHGAVFLSPYRRQVSPVSEMAGLGREL